MKQLAKTTVPVLALVALMWVVEAVNWALGHRLVQHGIVPRTSEGLVGIVFAPFLHGSVVHMASNTGPFLVLGTLVALSGAGRLAVTTLVVTLLGGAAVWMVARPAVHVGASLLIFGYFGYLVAGVFYERSRLALLLAAVTLVLYAGLIWGIVPRGQGISYEAHLFGFLAGVIAARLMRRSPARR